MHCHFHNPVSIHSGPGMRRQIGELAAKYGTGMDADGVVEVAMHGNPLLTSVRSRPG